VTGQAERHDVVIALGSNMGDRLEHLRAAIREMAAELIQVQRASSVWETAPVPADQPPFLNAVVVAKTALYPHQLLATLKAIEHRLGRRKGRRWGPRPIDLDILFYGDRKLEEEPLTIPHPRIAERGFVLAPLAEVCAGPLPVLGAPAKELLAKVGEEGLERTDEALL
jgi:2-amino-4-hydroxy-6-hydroxymethyldihydropteridine diphosphokinase